MTCFDPADRRGNRASVGESIARLGNARVTEVMELTTTHHEQRTCRTKAESEI